ncbi:LuxR C-terminal-related transcriptional regulator [Ruminococcaceae bacterium OttesenSCG-928-L11]|nr:LuxR C-terminal-related transcriptional regulator [Ruminococcaceae bacterium OttesenSCG-928-L11]
MPNRTRLPWRAELPCRPRIRQKLDEGIRSGLVIVSAGQGYGRTVELADYFRCALVRLVWLHLETSDNISTSFWQGMVRAVQAEFPAQAARLESLGFPDNLSKMDRFLRIFAEGVYGGHRAVMVIDDFDAVSDAEIRNFFVLLADAAIENFCLVLAGNTTVDLELRSLYGQERYGITAEDLRYTTEEIRELLHRQGLDTGKKTVAAVEAITEGWPLAISLLVPRLQTTPISQIDPRIFKGTTIDRFFERECLTGYSPGMQQLLIRLALPESFTVELAREIGTDAPEELDRILSSSQFITYDHMGGNYIFHRLYRAFLLERSHGMSSGERERIVGIAGRRYLERGQLIEAVNHFQRARMYREMLDAICVLANIRMGFSTGYADFMTEKLDSLPPEFVAGEPLVAYMRGVIHLNNLQISRSHEIFLELETRLQDHSDDVLLGNVYSMLGFVYMLRNEECFVDYFKRACRYLPHGTPLKKRNTLAMENNGVLSMQDNRPGALERMEKAIHEGIPYVVRVSNGGGDGMQHLFSAEAAYCRMDLQAASAHAYRAIYVAGQNEQHDAICNSYLTLAHVAVMQGDFAAVTEQLDAISTYIRERGLVLLHELRDTAYSWLYCKMGDPDRVPQWILDAGDGRYSQPPITIGRDRMVYLMYLLRKGRYRELADRMEEMEQLYRVRGLWANRLNLYILRAIAGLQLGQGEETLHAMWLAYDMSHQNGVIAPFLEGGRYMEDLVRFIRQSGDRRFDGKWLDRVDKGAAQYAAHIASMQAEYTRRNRQTESWLLTRREQQILHSLSQGLTREEIAAERGITVNTMKSSIRSIYNKLGAINRADAIRIGLNNGLLSEN